MFPPPRFLALNWLPCESPSQDELKETVLRMREKSLKATGCNAAIRAISAYPRTSLAKLEMQEGFQYLALGSYHPVQYALGLGKRVELSGRARKKLGKFFLGVRDHCGF